MGDRVAGAGERKAVRRLVRAAALGLALTLILAEPAWAKVVVVARDRAHGDLPTALTSGTVDNPLRLWVKVESRPKREVRVTWLTTCRKGDEARGRDGDFYANTPLTRAVKMGFRRPDGCSFTAKASLGAKGRIVVTLLARVSD